MKNKGLVITLAVIGVIALIAGAVMTIGFFWERRLFGSGCCQGSGYWNNSSGFGPGMMWGRGNSGRWQDSASNAEPLSLVEAENAVNDYIKGYDYDERLHIKEIMIFDNHAYVMVEEEDTGIGAFEVIVDPITLNVNLEQGASMMWNLKYGHMRGSMMGIGARTEDGRDMPILEEKAISIASDYLANLESELTVDDHADRFYGYYTIHTIANGEVAGMLSVNGYSGQIIIHNWHGELIEMEEHPETDH